MNETYIGSPLSARRCDFDHAYAVKVRALTARLRLDVLASALATVSAC
jgi:hypothetical protein